MKRVPINNHDAVKSSLTAKINQIEKAIERPRDSKVMDYHSFGVATAHESSGACARSSAERLREFK